MSPLNRLQSLMTGTPVAMDGVGRARIRAEQAYAIARATPILMLASVCAACVVLIALQQNELEPWAIGWAFLVCASSAYSYVLTIEARKRRRLAHVSSAAIAHIVGRSFLLGVLWAALPLVYFVSGETDAELVVFCVTCLMMGAGSFFMSALPGAAYVFLAPMLSGAVISILSIEGADRASLVAMFAIYGVALARMSHLYAAGLVSRLREAIAAERASGLDPATGLPNRDSFAQEIVQAYQRLDRFGEKFAVALVRFDFVDEEFETSASDALVVAFAKHLADVVDQTDFVGCTGDREFGIVLAGAGAASDAAVLIDRVVRSLALPTTTTDDERQVRWTAGIALAPKDGASVADILRAGAHALERADQRPEQTVCFFDDVDQSLVAERRALEADLRNAVALRQLRLQFQPILDVETNRIVSCEALVRWAHPERGMLAPDVFIPIAERTGLIHEIGEWIMREACRVLALLPADVHMAVNISAAQLRGQSVLSTLATALEGLNIANERIDIEVTESVLIAHDDPALHVVSALAEAGFSITLDDFGTGYASLNYLNRMPLKRVKIDRQFTSALVSDQRQAAIVNAILQLSKSLGLEVTAEGVETIAQLDLLRAFGCDAVQGYLVARPLSEDNLLDLFERRRFERAAA